MKHAIAHLLILFLLGSLMALSFNPLQWPLAVRITIAALVFIRVNVEEL